MIILLFLWDKKRLLKYTICHPHRAELSAFLLSFQGKTLLERVSAYGSPCHFFSRLLLFKNVFYINCFSNSVVEKNYSPIALNMKPPEETQVTTELFPVISLYSVDLTVGWCLYHVKTSSQASEALEDISISVITWFRCDCVWTIVGSQFDIHLRWYSCVY